MAAPRRSTARSISRNRSGSCKPLRRGLRKERAASASVMPRLFRMAANGSGKSSARASAADGARSVWGNCQRLARVSVLRIEPAHAAVGLDIVIQTRAEGHHFIRNPDKLFIPVGPQLIEVEVILVLEREFDGTGGAGMLAEFLQCLGVVAAVLAGHFALLEL